MKHQIRGVLALAVISLIPMQNAKASGPYMLLLTAGYPQPTAYTWTGKTGDGNFNTAGNWWGGVVPGAAAVAVFDYHYCSTHCDVTLNATVNVLGVVMNAYYPGTITQAAGIAVTVGTTGWKQYSGTFVGGNSGVTIGAAATTGGFYLYGGSYTATTGTMTVGNSNVDFTNTVFYASSTASFISNSGTVSFSGAGNGSGGSKNWTVNVPAGFSFANVIANVNCSSGNATLIATNAITVSGNFSHSGGILSGTWNVAGNLAVAAAAKSGTATINLNGNGTQTYSTSAGVTAKLVVNTTGTVAPDVGTTVLSAYSLSVLNGSFTAPSGTLTLGTQSDVSMTVLNIASGTTFNTNTGTVSFSGAASGGCGSKIWTVSVPAGFSFANVSTSVNCTCNAGVLTTASPITIAGNFAHTGGTLSGSWNVAGHLTIGAGAMTSSGSITLNGNGAQTYSRSSGATVALIINTTGTVAPAGGTTSLAAYSLSVLNGSFTAPTGTMTLGAQADSTMTVFNVASGTTFNTNTGTVSFSGAGSGSCGAKNWTVSVPAGFSFVNLVSNVNVTCGLGNLILGTNVTVDNSTTVSGGQIKMSGFSLTTLSLTLGTILKSGGTLTVNGSVVGTGSLYGGTVNP